MADCIPKDSPQNWISIDPEKNAIQIKIKNTIINIKKEPYQVLLLTAVMLFLAALFNRSNSGMDIQINDTYFVFAVQHFQFALSFLLIATWLVYVVTPKWLYSKMLTWAHIILTLVGCLLIQPVMQGTGLPRRYYDMDSTHTNMLFNPEFIIAMVMMAQVIYLVNVVLGRLKQ